MSGHHIKPSEDKLQRDERWVVLKPLVTKTMSKLNMNGRMLAKVMGLSPATSNKWFTCDCPTTPKSEIMDRLEAWVNEN